MKFSCERCGKRYATAEAPAPGRVYKIRCKACGHLIVVKGAAAPSSPAATSPAASRPPAAPPSPARPAGPAPELTPARLAAALERPDAPPAPPLPSSDQAFVDLFDDLGPADPPSHGGVGLDPFAPLRDELRTPPPEPPARAEPPAAPLVVRPAQRKGRGPVVLIGLGGLVLVGILAFVLLGGGGAPRPAAPPAAPQAQLPVQAPAPPRAPVSAPAPAAQPAGKAAAPERGAVRDPGPPQGARQRKPQQPPAVAEADGPLTAAQIAKVLAGARKSFGTCMAAAARSGDVGLDGRRVTLRVYVHANGSVTYPILDDPDLNASGLGSCLKSQARLLSFPKFQGETFQLNVPLVLATAR